MMKRVLLTTLVASVVLGGCVPDKLNTETEVKGLEGAAPVQTLREPGPETDVTMRPGGVLKINLSANATTGFQWQIGPELDETLVELTDKNYKSDPAPLGMVGVGGRMYFTFTAKQPGTTDIVLDYARDNRGSVDTRTIHVRVVE